MFPFQKWSKFLFLRNYQHLWAISTSNLNRFKKKTKLGLESQENCLQHETLHDSKWGVGALGDGHGGLRAGAWEEGRGG